MAGRLMVDAATAVGEAALNSIFQGVAQALTPIIQKKLGYLLGVDEELKKLKKTLLRIQTLLDDAEGRQFKEDMVRLWVVELRDVAYDVEDIVDAMNIELLRLQLKQRNKTDKDEVGNFSPSFWLDKVVDDFENINFRREMAPKIEDVLERLDDIIDAGNSLRLREAVGGRIHETKSRPETTSLVDEESVFGRDMDKEKNWLDYAMHDLIHDLAQFVSGSLCFGLLDESLVHSPTEMTRHLSLAYLDQPVLDSLSEIKGLRTFWGEGIMGEPVLQQLLQNMKCLRVLDLRFSQITHIPDSIGNLKHLRYLNLSETPLQKLPNSICHLYHLQSLLLSHCEYLNQLPSDMKNFFSMRHLSVYGTMIHVLPDSICYLEDLQILDVGRTELTELPADIGKLINLRSLNLQGLNIKKLPDSICMLYNLKRLNIKGCYWLLELPKNIVNLTKLRNLKVDSELLRKSFPLGMGRLTSLQKLKYYPVGKEPGQGIGELKDLNDLHGELNILDIDNILSVEEAGAANLKGKLHIKQLQLQWNCSTSLSLRDGTVEAEVLEALHPPCLSLKHLVLENYAGFWFPNWLGFTSFSCLVYVQLVNCKRCDILPPLGNLPCLKYLVIKQIEGIKHVGLEFCGNISSNAFPSLTKLEVEDMPNLEDWCAAREGAFPCLNDLSISFCPKLKELQVNFNNLKKLRVLVCDELTALPLLSSLEVLQLRGCKDGIILNSVPYLTTLSTLKISEIEGLKSLPDGLLQPLTLLRKLEIENCYELASFPDGLPALLTELSISHCPLLRSRKGKYILPDIVNISIDLPILPILAMKGGRKNLKRAVKDDGLVLQVGQSIMQVVSLRGSNLIEVLDAKGVKSLALFPAKFQKSLWIKSGSFVVVDENGREKALESGSKVACMVSQVLFYEQVRELQKSAEWPEVFKTRVPGDSSSDRKNSTPKYEESHSSDDEDGLPPLEINTNRIRPVELESISNSGSDSDSDSDTDTQL
ncbi:hypothetical protein H6P81_007743 [Aristolochia fimbriata]|uniref:S1-like domain-containing protein n=1 Tax=Aristolochia fimbriata TaxID=158543 RepID=A0AAV7F2F2_ARIFI|nr:hypothetical protein H6P81_007743 [Aristolochia fimbriata]